MGGPGWRWTAAARTSSANGPRGLCLGAGETPSDSDHARRSHSISVKRGPLRRFPSFVNEGISQIAAHTILWPLRTEEAGNGVFERSGEFRRCRLLRAARRRRSTAAASASKSVRAAEPDRPDLAAARSGMGGDRLVFIHRRNRHLNQNGETAWPGSTRRTAARKIPHRHWKKNH